MRNQNKTGEKLINELVEISKRSAELEALEERYNQKKSLQDAKERILSYIEKLEVQVQRHTARIEELEMSLIL